MKYNWVEVEAEDEGYRRFVCEWDGDKHYSSLPTSSKKTVEEFLELSSRMLNETYSCKYKEL